MSLELRSHKMNDSILLNQNKAGKVWTKELNRVRWLEAEVKKKQLSASFFVTNEDNCQNFVLQPLVWKSLLFMRSGCWGEFALSRILAQLGLRRISSVLKLIEILEIASSQMPPPPLQPKINQNARNYRSVVQSNWSPCPTSLQLFLVAYLSGAATYFDARSRSLCSHWISSGQNCH